MVASDFCALPLGASVVQDTEPHVSKWLCNHFFFFVTQHVFHHHFISLQDGRGGVDNALFHEPVCFSLRQHGFHSHFISESG